MSDGKDIQRQEVHATFETATTHTERRYTVTAAFASKDAADYARQAIAIPAEERTKQAGWKTLRTSVIAICGLIASLSEPSLAPWFLSASVLMFIVFEASDIIRTWMTRQGAGNQSPTDYQPTHDGTKRLP